MKAYDYAYWIRDTSNDGFKPESRWKQVQIEKERICRACGTIFPKTAGEIQHVVVENVEPVKIHDGLLQDTDGCMLSQRLIAAIGRATLSAIGAIVPIVSKNGDVYTTHECVIGIQLQTGLVRGNDASHAKACQVCGRIMYWPGWPPKSWYIINKYWNAELPCQFVGGMLFVEKQIYEREIETLRLPKVYGSKIRLVDVPADGLPVDFDELKNVISLRG